MNTRPKRCLIALSGVAFLSVTSLCGQAQEPEGEEGARRAAPRLLERGLPGRRSDKDAERRPTGGPEMFLKLPIIAALDADGDGTLSTKEIENAVAALKTLDKNGDGKIDLNEMVASAQSGGDEEKSMIDRLMRRDRDGDGFLSNREMPGPLARIIQRDDENGDGRLSREEVRNSVRKLLTRRNGSRSEEASGTQTD